MLFFLFRHVAALNKLEKSHIKIKVFFFQKMKNFDIQIFFFNFFERLLVRRIIWEQAAVYLF